MSPGLALAPTLSPRRYQSRTPRLSRPRSRRALSQAPALAAERLWAALLPPPRDKRGAWHRRAGFGSQEGRGTAGTVRLAGWVGRAGRTPNRQQPLSTWVSAAAPARAGTPGPSTCLLWAPGDGRRLILAGGRPAEPAGSVAAPCPSVAGLGVSTVLWARPHLGDQAES